MSAMKRQMHLGVFWLGTGNHSAGWRHEGATTRNSSWPVVQAGAQNAERGKIDLVFISEPAGEDPRGHPPFLSPSQPTTPDPAAAGAGAPPSPRASASRSTSPAPLPRSTISAAGGRPGTSSPAPTTRQR